MPAVRPLSLALTALLLPLGGLSGGLVFGQTPPKVDFARDVQPILKAHCYQCHSGAQRQGGLALDTRALALKGGASGASFVPGKSASSLLLSSADDLPS